MQSPQAAQALKLLMSNVAVKGRDHHIMLSDVKRAYFHAPTERELYVELPPEDPEYGTGKVGKLNIPLYGTRDAAANWQRCVADHRRSLGFTQGRPDC